MAQRKSALKLFEGDQAGRHFSETFECTWMNVGVVINPQLAFGQVQLRVSPSLTYKKKHNFYIYGCFLLAANRHVDNRPLCGSLPAVGCRGHWGALGWGPSGFWCQHPRCCCDSGFAGWLTPAQGTISESAICLFFLTIFIKRMNIRSCSC